ERCSYMLHGGNVSPAEFEFKSVPPRSAQDEPFVPAPESLRTSNPAMSSTHVDLQGKSSRLKPLAYVAIAAILFGGAYGASRTLFAPPGAAPAAAAAALPVAPKGDAPRAEEPIVGSSVAAATAATASASPEAVVDAGRLEGKSTVSRSAARRSVSSAAARRAAPAATRPVIRQPDEVDVGF
ncbi:MAG TPA: hypothetical protein VK524_01575, partial [Polyangiaceae bacterium]|nr:hypothetical protein [Polyangiaceae bacterium]